MDKGKIGVQMMMLKNEVKQNGIYEVLKRLSDIGYRAVEVSQLDITEDAITDMQRAMKDFDMTIAAMSCGVADIGVDQKYPGDTLEHDFDKIVRDCKAVNCTILRIGMLPVNYMGSREKALEFAQVCNDYAKRLKEEGIDLYYHAHNMEFIRYDGKFMLEHMRDNAPELGFELDTHWIWRAGLDPREIIPLFRDRIRAIHLKDYRVGEIQMDKYPGQGMEKLYFMLHMVTEFAEVGEGTLPIKDCMEIGLECGAEYFFVEQDELYGKDPYDCLLTSKDNLIALGFKDWF